MSGIGIFRDCYICECFLQVACLMRNDNQTVCFFTVFDPAIRVTKESVARKWKARKCRKQIDGWENQEDGRIEGRKDGWENGGAS